MKVLFSKVSFYHALSSIIPSVYLNSSIFAKAKADNSHQSLSFSLQ